jgi:hypothetical protein
VNVIWLFGQGVKSARSAAGTGALLALLLAVGCGGKARATDQAAETAGGSASSGGGAPAAAGASSVAGMGSATGAEPQQQPGLDDIFPWFEPTGEGHFPFGERDEILHLVATGAPARAGTSTHNVVDMLSWARFVQFSARASLPTRLLVSAGYTQLTYDYFEARESDRPWPTVGVEVGSEWQEFSVVIADMEPPEMRIDTTPTFFLGLSVEHPEPVEIWIDDVQFLPAP